MVGPIVKTIFLNLFFILFLGLVGCTNRLSTDTQAETLSQNKAAGEIQPDTKTYANSIIATTGVLNYGGQLIAVNFDVATQNIDIGLKLPVPILFLAQAQLLKYPQITTSVVVNTLGDSILHLNIPLEAAVAAYKKWKSRPSQQNSNPTEVTSSLIGHYQGQIDPPPREIRLANRDKRLIEQGYTPTGTDADNALTGGGGLDGGIYLAGAFQFDVDSNYNITSGEFIIHGYSFPVSSGKMNKDGSFTIDASQLPVRGRWNGTSFDYTANELGGSKAVEPGREWVYGDMVGTFTPAPK